AGCARPARAGRGVLRFRAPAGGRGGGSHPRMARRADVRAGPRSGGAEMNAGDGHWSDFGMDTISLAGPLETKLRAIRGAGFSQVMLSAGDLAGHARGVEGAIQAVRDSGLRLTAFQLLRDFEGLDGALHAYKVDVARSLIEMCSALGAPILVATSSALSHASADRDVIVRDLRKLAML